MCSSMSWRQLHRTPPYYSSTRYLLPMHAQMLQKVALLSFSHELLRLSPLCCPQNLLNYKRFKATLHTLSRDTTKLIIFILILPLSIDCIPIDSRIWYKLSPLCNNCLNSNQPASDALRLVLSFFVFPANAHTRLVRRPFRMLLHLSGTLHLATSGHPRPFHPSNHL